MPEEILTLFSNANGKCNIARVTCVHMFEMSPQSKCAVAYKLTLPSGEEEFVVVIFSTTASQMQRMIRADSEVTQMCTSGNDSVLICGTIYGSIVVYDLQNFETSTSKSDDLNFETLLQQSLAEEGEGETN